VSLTLDKLREAAAAFALSESASDNALIYGVTDGKAIGTYLEQKFRDYLAEYYDFEKGNSASGIDFPSLKRGYQGHKHQATSIVLPV